VLAQAGCSARTYRALYPNFPKSTLYCMAIMSSSNDSDESRHVLVIGAAGIDMVGRLENDLTPATSNAASIRTSFGGVARNVAENLARLGQPVTLLAAIGRDPYGDRLLDYTEKAGVNVSHVLRVADHDTGTYLAVVNRKGELQFGLHDMGATTNLDSDYLRENQELFMSAAAVFIDANLSPKSLRTAMSLARKARLPIYADPSSASLAARLNPYLSHLSMIAPNSAEAAVLCDNPFEVSDEVKALQAAKHLVSQGVDLAIVTMAEFGVTYASSLTSGHISAIRTDILDPTGAGDALTAAVIFALLNELTEDEAVRLGISAASLTLRWPGTVVPGLSLETLYDQLVI
jgi:pseudouridine kinase